MATLAEYSRRRTDTGTLCWIALRASQFWDWIDGRQVGQHGMAVAILWGTVRVTEWAMTYAMVFEEKPGIEVAAILGAVLAPYMALQAAAIKFYFDARKR